MTVDQESLWLGIAIGIAVCAIITAGGAGYFYVQERDWRRRLSAKYPDVTQPICGCRHHRSFHDHQGCHHRGKPRYEDEQVCGCKVYIGPAVEIPQIQEERRRR